jgi:hypothetical protein
MLEVMTTRWAFPLLLIVALASDALLAESGRPMELVSEAGRLDEVKIYSGEALTFRVREKSDGLRDMFSGGGEFLHGVSFELREWPKVTQDRMATIKGANRRVVRQKRPEPELWGIGPSSFSIEGECVGRYKLTASKPGYAPVSVLINLAAFEIVDIDGELTEDFYRAVFSIRLVDPTERGKAIPLTVESLDEEGRLVDARKDVVLAPVNLEPGVYRTNRRIHLSSHALETFKERLARKDEASLPPEFFDLFPLRIVEGGMLRISFRSLRAGYPLPLGY